jgi:hypothetical protein
MFSGQAALDENNYGALTQLQQEAIPLQNRLVEALDNMTNRSAEANEAALGKTFDAYQATRNLMLVLGIFATLLATLVAVLVSCRMLTQTRQLEMEKQKYQTLFETNSDAVVILEDKGFTDCNSSHAVAVRHGLGRHLPGTPFRSSARRFRRMA